MHKALIYSQDYGHRLQNDIEGIFENFVPTGFLLSSGICVEVDVPGTIDESDFPYLTYDGTDFSVDQAEKDKETREQTIRTGKAFTRELPNKIIDYMGGLNITRGLTEAQKDQLALDTAAIMTDLQQHRPGKAFQKILAFTPDGTLVTQQMKDDIIAIFAEYGISV